MKKIRETVRTALFGLGLTNICYALAAHIIPDHLKLRLLYSVDVLCLIIVIIARLVIRGGVSPREKWIRRGVLILIGCILSPSVLVAFDLVIDFEKFYFLLPFSTAILILSSVIGYLIGDGIERRNIRAINERLSENSKSADK